MKHTNLSIIMSIIIIVQLFSISTPISVTAYTSCDGIEEGDVALVQYTGTYDPDGDGVLRNLIDIRIMVLNSLLNLI